MVLYLEPRALPSALPCTFSVALSLWRRRRWKDREIKKISGVVSTLMKLQLYRMESQVLLHERFDSCGFYSHCCHCHCFHGMGWAWKNREKRKNNRSWSVTSAFMWVSNQTALRVELQHQLSLDPQPASAPADFGFTSLHNHMNQFRK